MAIAVIVAIMTVSTARPPSIQARFEVGSNGPVGFRVVGSTSTGSGVELVPDPPDGLDVTRSIGVGFDLFSNPAHVDRDRAHVAGEVIVPDLIEELFAAEHLTRIPGEKVEQIELFRGEVDRPTSILNRSTALIHFETAVTDQIARLSRRGF